MSAKIYYLRPFQRKELAAPTTEPEAEEGHSEASPERPAGKRPVRNQLPGGRNSKWKRKLGGGAVRREPGAGNKDGSVEE